MTIIANQQAVTPAVLKVMQQTDDPRLREIMVALVTHLHAFVRDVRLTEEEFREATRILNTMGQQTTDSHNEFVLMAGSLGVSSLVCLLNNGDNGTTETVQSLLGPFWRLNQPLTENGGSILRSETPGPRLYGRFAFVDRDGAPIGGLEVDIWHASPVGLYENQDDSQAEMNLRGKFITGDDGVVTFKSVRPVGYPIPTHTTVGRLLKAQNRHPYRPAHVHVLAHKAGSQDPDQPDLCRRDRLPDLGRAVRRHRGAGRRGCSATPNRIPRMAMSANGSRSDHRLMLEPGESKLPIPPIK